MRCKKLRASVWTTILISVVAFSACHKREAPPRDAVEPIEPVESSEPSSPPTPAKAKPEQAKPDMTSDASIGAATMQPDGTIVLDLRAEGPNGAIGDARIVYPKGHKDYDSVLKHLGGLKPGESKPVPPWPD